MAREGTGRGEFALIADLFAPLSTSASGALGLLDDAAVLDIPAGHQLVAAADALIAGVHFRVDDPPGLIARKALRVNLSDLAAMGAKPLGFLQTLTLNETTDDAFLGDYAEGLKQDVDTFACPLMGGDTTSGPGPFSITVAVLGVVESGAALLRSGAHENDVLCVTGTIGDASLGLLCLEDGIKVSGNSKDKLISRYQLPQPRLSIGQGLAGLATSCIDISDGLVADVGHICTASNTSAAIEQSKIPLSGESRAILEDSPGLWPRVLGGGDDYELAFTVAEERLNEALDLGRKENVPVTPIGRIIGVNGGKVGVTVRGDGGAEVQVSTAGYTHR